MSDRLKEIFVEPQTCYKFTEKEVANNTLNELYNLVKWGPTSFNSSPMRLKFLKSSTSKEKLSQLVIEDNISKVINADVCTIIGIHIEFCHDLSKN